MDRIIFDNVQRGFPANEKFMQMVDKNRLALLEVCRGIFGDRPTILKGVETTITPPQGPGTPRVDISSGVVWTGSDLVYIKESLVETDSPSRALAVVISNSKEKGKFHDGNEYDAYLRNEGEVISAEWLPDEMLLHNYIRAQALQPVVSQINVSNMSSGTTSSNNVAGTLQQMTYPDGRVRVYGMVSVSIQPLNTGLSQNGIKVARISASNKDIIRLTNSLPTADSPTYGAVYPAGVTMYGTPSLDGNEEQRSISHFIKMTRDGSIYVYIPIDKIDPNAIDARIFLISIDFTFNSK